jgi:hypothetical protein
MLSKFDSVDSIVNYLREPTVSSTVVVSSTVKGSPIINNELKSSKNQQKEKDLLNLMNTTSPSSSEGEIQILPKGRVR